MQCVICGQAKQDHELLVFSQDAYTKILSILKINDPKIDTAVGQNDPPVRVCKGCLQGVYEYSSE